MKNWKLLLTLSLLLVVLMASPGFAGRDTGCCTHRWAADWMKYVEDTSLLTKLAIPGTHDSAANVWAQGKVQNWDILKQLESGIRFLDIRLKEKNSGETWVEHGPFDLCPFKECVFDQVIRFLHFHPTETVFMSIKEESDGRFNETAWKGAYPDGEVTEWYLKRKEWFYQSNVTSTTTMNDVRKKIVIVDREGAFTGLEWGITSRQDEYELKSIGTQIKYDWKWNYIKAHLDKAKADDAGQTFWVNFTSAHQGGGKADNNADYQNPKVKDYYNSQPANSSGVKYQIGGFILMDFPKYEEINAIIDHTLLHH